jgi:hypothetical protein
MLMKIRRELAVGGAIVMLTVAILTTGTLFAQSATPTPASGSMPAGGQTGMMDQMMEQCMAMMMDMMDDGEMSGMMDMASPAADAASMDQMMEQCMAMMMDMMDDGEMSGMMATPASGT